VTETPFFFERGQARLFGILHHGAGSPLAFVMSHPFGEEKLWTHRVFVSLARALALRGHSVLRFDYTGAGDSSGTTTGTSLETHVDDLSAAVDVLKTRCTGIERIGLIGMRFGATVAALFAERAGSRGLHPQLNDGPLVLWDPILDGENYFQELLRSNLSTQLAVFGKVVENREVLQERIRAGGVANVDGYDIGQSLFVSSARKDLLTAEAKRHLGPVFVVQIAANEKQKLREDLQELARSYGRGAFALTTEQPFWREIKPFYGRAAHLQQATLQWLEQCDG
jgi:uncharacterized protein